jgi:hypothetical protein
MMSKIPILKATRLKLLLTLTCLILAVSVVGFAVIRVALWFDNNKIVFNKPITVVVKTQKMVQIQKREAERIVEYIGQNELDKLIAEAEQPELAQYICDKWGPVHCPTALAVAKAESGMREDGVNSNDGSPRNIDVGIFQINLKYHGHKPGCSLKELADAYTNVDCAFSLWQEQGWGIWVAYTRNMHLAHLPK